MYESWKPSPRVVMKKSEVIAINPGGPAYAGRQGQWNRNIGTWHFSNKLRVTEPRKNSRRTGWP